MSERGVTYEDWPLVRKLRDAAECWRDIRDTQSRLFTDAADCIERLERELDLFREFERIESMSDEEILAEARANGVDLVEQAKRIKEMLLEAAKRTREAKERCMTDPRKYR